MATYIVETKSGSLYKVEQAKDGWYIYMPKVGRTKIIAVGGMDIEDIKLGAQFKGQMLWFEVYDKEKGGNTSPIQKVYQEAA